MIALRGLIALGIKTMPHRHSLGGTQEIFAQRQSLRCRTGGSIFIQSALIEAAEDLVRGQRPGGAENRATAYIADHHRMGKTLTTKWGRSATLNGQIPHFL